MRASIGVILLVFSVPCCGPSAGSGPASPPRVVHAVAPPEPEQAGSVPEAPTGPNAVAQMGHSMDVWAVAWSPRGDRIATGGFDHTIRVWTEGGKLLGVLRGHREAITDLAWSAGSDVLASAARDGTVRLWDLHHRGRHRVLEKAGDHVAFEPSGERVASVGYDLQVRIWNVKSGKLEHTLSASRGRQLRAVAWSKDGTRIAASALDGPLFVWDAKSSALVMEHAAFGGAMQRLRFSPDGRSLAGGGSRPAILDVGSLTGHDLAHAGVSVGEVSFSPDGKTLLTDGSYGQVHLWSAETGKHLRALAHPGYVNAVAWGPTGNRIAVCGKVPVKSPDGGNNELPTARVYDASTGKLVAHLEGAARPVSGAAFSPSGDLLLTASPELVLWDARTGARKRVLYPAGAMDFDLNPKLPLAAITGRGIVRVLDIDTGREVGAVRAEEPEALWSPDGTQLAVRSMRAVTLFDVERKRARPVGVKAQGTLIRSVAFTSDSSELGVAVRDRVDVFRVSTRALVRSYSLKAAAPSWQSAEQLSFGPTGALGATLNGPGLLVFESNAGPAVKLADRTLFALPAFSPDGRVLAYSAKNDVVLWGSLNRRLYGHDDVVRSVSWSPDGKRLASSSDDSTVRVWDPAKGTLEKTFDTHSGRVWSVDWHPLGRALLAVGNDAQIHRLKDDKTLSMVVTPGGSAGAWYTAAGEYSGSLEALSGVLLRPSDDLLAPNTENAARAWKHAPELLSLLD